MPATHSSILAVLMLMTFAGADAAEGQITIAVSTPTGQGSPLIFGGNKVPNPDHMDDMMPKLAEAGVTFIRNDMRNCFILPKDMSLEDYKANKKNVQDPSTWDWSWGNWIDAAKKHGMTTQALISFVSPGWLTHNGNTLGVPKDWDVYEDITRKIFVHYKGKIDYVEGLNEMRNFIKLQKSPYTDPTAATKDMLAHFIKAIRSVDPSVPICAASEDHWDAGFGITRAILGDQSFKSSDINAITMHDYEYGGVRKAADLRKMLTEIGRGSLPIMMNEWNCTSGYQSGDERLGTHKGISYHGKQFIEFYNNGWFAANYFCFMVRNVKAYDPFDNKGKVLLGFYNWDEQTKSGTLVPAARAWRVASRQLGMGAGPSTVLQCSSASKTSAMGAINSSRQIIALLANDTPAEQAETVTFTDVRFVGDPKVELFCASQDNEGKVPTVVKKTIAASTLSCSVTLPPYATIGIRITGGFTAVPRPSSE